MGQGLIQKDRILFELKRAVANALGVDEESVRSESVLTNDLEAESLDFLDISYNLEQTFGFKMARYFILEHAEEMFGEGSAIDDQDRLTEKGVKLLNRRFGVNQTVLTPGMDVDGVVHLVTVESMAKAINDILDTLPEKCPACDVAGWKTEDATHVLCGSCGEHAVYKNGDDLVVDWLTRVQQEESIF